MTSYLSVRPVVRPVELSRLRETSFRVLEAALAIFFVSALISYLEMHRISLGIAALIATPCAVLFFRLSNAVVQHVFRFAIPPKKPARNSLCTVENAPLLVLPVILSTPGTAAAIRQWLVDALPFANRLPIAILVDLPDAPFEVAPGDAEAIEQLRASLAPELENGTAVIAVRCRRYDPVDHVWRGWERKRGKLIEFCRLLIKAGPTSFEPFEPDWGDAPTIVTIDLDTRLRSGTIAALHAASSFDTAIVSPAIRAFASARPTFFERLQTPQVSDPTVSPQPSFSQGWFGHDLFFGKGLLRVSPFLERVAGRIPERTALSHDHLEALLAGAVSTSEAVLDEPVPTSRRSWAARQYRWIRGDLQLVRWIFGRELPVLARLRLIDNVLIHATPLALVAAIVVALLCLPAHIAAVVIVLAFSIVTPGLLLLPLEVGHMLAQPHKKTCRPLTRLAAIADGPVRGWTMTFIFCGLDALLLVRATGVTMWRMAVTGRNMLQWNDRAELERSRIPGTIALLLSLASAALLAARGDAGSDALAAFVLVWTFAPIAMEALSDD